MEPTETKTIGKYRIDVILDEDPYNPRDNDNLGTMVCFHGRYNLGDKNHGIDHNMFGGWGEMSAYIVKKEKVAVILPLYLYDHSGITISTSPFSCPWDSGSIGFIFVSKEKVRKEFSRKRMSKKLIQRMKEYLKSEVETYDQYLTGDCYGFRITDTETDEEMDNCWGYYGEEYCMSEAESVVKYLMKSDEHGQLELKLE